MTNLTPDQYRQVALAEVEFELTDAALADHFVGREVYRRTRYVVVVAGGATAVIEVDKDTEEPLFAPVTACRVIARPPDCQLVYDETVDTAIPSHLARAAITAAPDAGCVAVVGRYAHLSFIVNPSVTPIIVRDVVPPRPAKLFDQATRLVDTSEDLPPIDLIPDVVDLDSLIEGPGEYLLPCAGAATDAGRTNISYLDQRPEPRDWTLIGCARSQQIHSWFYGRAAPVDDFCPRLRTSETNAIVLTKCCLLESGIEVQGSTVVVPWGSTLTEVTAGLHAAAELARRLPAAADRPQTADPDVTAPVGRD